MIRELSVSRKAILLIVISFGLCFTGWWFVSDPRTRVKDAVRQAEISNDKTRVDEASTESGSPDSRAVPTAVGKDVPLTPLERKSLAAALDSIKSTLQEDELQRLKVIGEYDFENFQSQYFEITRTDQSLVDKVHRKLSEEMSRLGPRSLARETLQAAALRMIADYTDRPKKHKVIAIKTRKLDGVVHLMEFLTDDPNQVVPNSRGELRFKLGKAEGGVLVRDDPEFGADGTWGTARYGYLLEDTR